MSKLGKNESKTEIIVRDHFRKYFNDIVFEEKKSDNPRITKLLSAASKSGTGQGYPEFIIQYKNNADLLIIIECKADITKHESNSRNQPKDYAVDGALLYSSYLAREFDVISIGVSGENERELKVSHFLQLKGDKRAVEKFSSKLLPVGDYLNGYIKSPEKFRQDYDKLLSFSKELNDKLHGYKILESDRSVLIGCILIALENSAFLESYKYYLKPEDLAKFLADTAELQFKNSGIQEQKLKVVKSSFEFIKTDKSLSTVSGVLREIITDINDNVNSFIRTHKYFDVLGQLYIEFLRYANSDKGLGIVLTPPHITEFMAELAEVNKNSVVYDNCAGTGGFLISAMKLMIKDAKDDQEKIDYIKQHQIVGTEYQSKIFTLACCNMFIHQDGKTSILNGDCFDKEIISKVKTYNPTVGLLNPPYKADKKKDTEELEYVLNNLECLEQGGKLAAIVPMQSALAQSGKIFELKKKLLEQHTLEAVLSMPNELFFNSNTSVVSCIMLFTAKRPHPSNKKTFFGYFKDDGFVKRRKGGRIDAYGKWESIKEKWIKAYINKENIAGLSVNKIVGAKDEWCAEAYMETDYKKVSEEDFSETILNFVTYKLGNKKILNVAQKPILKKTYSLNVSSWKLFKLDDLFQITGSTTTPVLELEEYGKGEYPYVTTQATNNGVGSFYNFYTEEGEVLTVDSAVLGYCSYQPYNFSASDHVEKLIPKFKMNKYVAMFLVTIINQEQYRYNYGRKCSQERMKKGSIKLPSKNENPDWEFMENYIKSLPYSSNL